MRLFALIAFVSFFAFCAFSSTAHADKDQAREHFKKGMAAYDLDHWDDAIGEWEQAYVAYPEPTFMYNIAQAYRLSKRPEKAIEFYRKYLKFAGPTASNAPAVEKQIATLEAQVAEEKAAQKRGLDLAAKNTAVAPSPLGNKEAQPAFLPSTAPPPQRKTWPIWVGVAAGVVAVAALAIGLGVGLSSSEPTLPTLSLR